MTVAQQKEAAGITWRHLLRYAAIADLVVMAVVGIAVRDKEALAFAAAILIGILFLRIRSGLTGIIMIGVLSWSLGKCIAIHSHLTDSGAPPWGPSTKLWPTCMLLGIATLPS